MRRLSPALAALLLLVGCTATTADEPPVSSPAPATATLTSSPSPSTPTDPASATESPTQPASPSPTLEAASADTPLTVQGWGDVRPGEGVPATHKVKPAWECYGPIVLGSDGDELMQVWVQKDGDDRSPVTTLAVANPRIKTDGGIHMGSSMDEFKQAYPSAQEESAETSATDAPVWIVPGDTHSLVFEFEQTMVAYISLQPNDAERFYHFSTQLCGGP